jgi:membrane protein DedA with SNARE-associated domain
LSLLSDPTLSRFVAAYGYWAVFCLVALESSGLPLPGEATLIAAALYAGTTHEIGIAMVIVAAACGAVLGDNIGYWVGRTVGLRLLLRYGPYVRLTEARLKLGRYLFLRHGGKIVFFGRFVAVLRALAALLAGANRMGWRRFLVFNAAGGLAWAALYGGASFLFGEAVHRLAGPIGIATLMLGIIVIVVSWFAFRRHEKRLEAIAEQAFPGPLVPPHRRRREVRE